MLLVTAIFISNADQLLAAWHYTLPLNVIISGIWEVIVMGSLTWIRIYNLGINCSWCNYTSAFRYRGRGLGGSCGHSERTTLKSCMVRVFLTSLTDWPWYICRQAGTWGSITPSSNQPPVVIVLMKFGYPVTRVWLLHMFGSLTCWWLNSRTTHGDTSRLLCWHFLHQCSSF